MKISIIIPVYNEAQSISPLVQGIDKCLSNSPYYEYEIIIVNDGSSDGSDKVIYSIKNIPSLSMKTNFMDLGKYIFSKSIGVFRSQAKKN